MACNFPTDNVIVVGGGLAGVSACNTVVENGARTVLIDKSSFCGGNSTKATSGINGAATRSQKAKGIEDSTDLFTKDTLKGGAKRPEIAKVLCENSGRDVEWLMDAFNLDLSLVARLGGHSAPRTHRGAERFPGMTITYALIQMVEKIAETTDKARIITKAKATQLLQDPAGGVCGLVYEKGGLQFQEHGPVILCTGGFGADFTADSLLAKYRPDLLHLPTTNGEHCTGDGIKMGEAIGAKTIDLEWVQVHPTGLVKPDDADAKIKFLAAEALRGVGGIVLNNEGKRFANELGRRDYVTGEMWKSKPPFRLCLNKAASDEIIWHCKHYTGRGVMKFYQSGEALAQDMGVPLSVLEETHQLHYEAAQKTEKDPDGGSWPAYPSGKSWDEPSGKTGSGKKFYHNIIPGSAVKSEPFYVAIITPVIHYCMGGLEIDADGAVFGASGKVIPGLYCAGEVAGGVHGNNRLGGNSLLDCVVFGRVTGVAATKYILGDDVKTVDLKELTGGGLDGEVKASKLSGGSYEDNMNDSKGAAKPDAAAAADGAAAPAKKKKKKEGGGGGGLTMSEVEKHVTKGDCWVVVAGDVLNVTNFLSQHPGGELAILTFAGKDATEEFNMIHPPDVIPKYAPDAIIGKLGEGGGDEEEEDEEEDDAGAGGGAAAAPKKAEEPRTASGHKVRTYKQYDANRKARLAKTGKVDGWLGAALYMVLGFLKEIIFTIFGQKNITLDKDRVGLTRSALFLFVFLIIHAIGNLHVFLGPDDFNGYGYFYVRLYWSGFGLEANIVEEYVALCAMLHVVVALKRTYDISLSYSMASGKLNLAISGITLLCFMTIHLMQYRFGVTQPFAICPPPYLINLHLQDILSPEHPINLFWVPGCKFEDTTYVRDIYRLEFEIFKSFGWCFFYVASVCVFATHMCLGWQKVVPAPALDLPKRYHSKATHVGYVMTIAIAAIYVSFPVYCHSWNMKPGNFLLEPLAA